MSETKTETVYFSAGGRANTARTLELAYSRARELGLGTILVATTSGETALRAAELCEGMTVIAVTHSAGFREPDTQELTVENRAAIEAAGGQILTCQHALGGVNRAVRKKFATFELDEIIAHTLRVFGQGVKVVAEIALMAADAGLVRTDTPVMAVGGSGWGADTAAVVLPTNAQTFFDLKIPEIVCRPSPAHPLAGN